MTDSIRAEIVANMATAFYACAWADQQEEDEDGVNLSGCEILDVMPQDDNDGADDAAEHLATQMEELNGKTLPEIMALGKGGDRPCDAEHFGHYAAMQAMGHGVGLESVGMDSHGNDAAVKVPNIEFSHYDL
jgi:acetylornithine deacetylase/succinyl-diaminopimelate desuccinylase-like protein